jgi:hypothetical protein
MKRVVRIGRWFIGILVFGLAITSTRSDGADDDAAHKLQLRLTLNKQTMHVGDKIVARFQVINISTRPVTFIKNGALYSAFWFQIEPKGGSLIRPERQLEKLLTGEFSKDDLVTLAPRATFTKIITAVLELGKGGKDSVLLKFWDSDFALRCGETYQITGLFWAHPDDFGKMKVTSGRISSAPQEFRVVNCK